MELLQVADNVAREKNIDVKSFIEAMEEAIQKAGRSKYGHDHDIRAHIDRRSGVIELKRYREVMEDGAEIENEVAQLPLRKRNANQRLDVKPSVNS
jgi:N utilization substance protein A